MIEILILKVFGKTLWHKIKEFKPDITSITCLFSVTHNSYKDVCFELKNSESLKINNLEEIPFYQEESIFHMIQKIFYLKSHLLILLY